MSRAGDVLVTFSARTQAFTAAMEQARASLRQLHKAWRKHPRRGFLPRRRRLRPPPPWHRRKRGRR